MASCTFVFQPDGGNGSQQDDDDLETAGSDLDISEEEWDSDEDVPLADIIPLAELGGMRDAAALADNTDRRWTADFSPITFEKFEEEAGPITTLDADSEEQDFFHLIFPTSLYDIMELQTNLYAGQKIAEKPDSAWKPTTSQEMKAYLGIIIFMSLVDLPTYKMYWSKDRLFQTSMPDIITRLRFEKLTQYLHLNDSKTNPPRDQPGHDRLHHVRPVLDVISNTISAQYTLHQDFAIDEAMVAYKGRLSFKQYMPAKPTKFGIKVWERADSNNGYVDKLQIYTGRAGNNQNPGGREVGLGGRVVTDLTRDIVGSHRHLYVDNFFSSPQLFKDLLNDGIYACGTCRVNRKGFPSSINKESVKQKGDFVMMQSGNMVATAWYDNKPVTFLSTNTDPTCLVPVGRKNKDGTNRVQLAPAVVSRYSNNMNAVDRADQMRMQYTCTRKSYKWWKYLFFFLVDTAIVNSFILMKESPNHQRSTKTGRPKPYTQLEFRENLCRQLIGDTRAQRKRCRTEMSGTSLNHWPVKASKSRCKRCSQRQVRHTTSFACKQCQVSLCIGCFETFHKQQQARVEEE